VKTILKRLSLIDVVNNRIESNVNIAITDDIIADIFHQDKPIDFDHCQTIDCDGCFALPGLIDLHTHLVWSAGIDPVVGKKIHSKSQNRRIIGHEEEKEHSTRTP
jgi:predicted amidohydrolase